MEKLLLRPSEVADALGLGRTRIYALIGSGEIPSVKIGGSIRVPTERLREWVLRRAALVTGGATRG
jgi:excisionase family DNA binding protein